jgi:flagellar hook-associated protein 3 FlgL
MAISPLSPRDSQFLTAANRLSSRINRAQLQISSGKRIQQASDAPDQVDNLLGLRADLARATQIQKNLGRVKTETDTAERALESAVKVTERIRVLASRGATNLSETAESRAIYADEVSVLLEELVSIANTQVEGRYIFAGDDDRAVPYQINAGPPQAISGYGGSRTLRSALHPSGSTFTFAVTAEQIFDNPDPAKNVFASVIALRDALLADDQAAIQAALPGVDTAARQVVESQAAYGNIQSRVAAAETTVNENILRFKSQIAEIEDADLTEAILELNSAKQTQEAAFSSKARAPRSSLFDFLG